MFIGRVNIGRRKQVLGIDDRTELKFIKELRLTLRYINVECGSLI